MEDLHVSTRRYTPIHAFGEIIGEITTYIKPVSAVTFKLKQSVSGAEKTSLPGLLRLRTVPNDALNMPIRIESAKRKWNGAKKRCVEFRPG